MYKKTIKRPKKTLDFERKNVFFCLVSILILSSLDKVLVSVGAALATTLPSTEIVEKAPPG